MKKMEHGNYEDVFRRGTLTVEEKMNCAEERSREEVAEKHFFDIAKPFYPLGFNIVYRNPGHWDVYARQVPGKASAWLAAHPNGKTSAKDGETERAFRIRGGPGDIIVMDERWDPYRPFPRNSIKFRSIIGAMVWIMEELMQEPPEEKSMEDGDA
jgi:hypothetical protein